MLALGFTSDTLGELKHDIEASLKFILDQK